MIDRVLVWSGCISGLARIFGVFFFLKNKNIIKKRVTFIFTISFVTKPMQGTKHSLVVIPLCATYHEPMRTMPQPIRRPEDISCTPIGQRKNPFSNRNLSGIKIIVYIQFIFIAGTQTPHHSSHKHLSSE